MLVALVLLSIGASPCAVVHLEAELLPGLRRVQGSVTCRVASDGPLAVAAYPRVLAEPHGLDDVSRHWIYPNGFSKAWMTLHRGADGVSDGSRASRIPLGDVRAGDEVSLGFSTQIPERNGTFGRRNGVAYLLGGWHPAFVRQDRLDSTPITYTVRVPNDVAGLMGREPFSWRAPRILSGRFFGRYVPLLAAGEMAVEQHGEALVLRPSRRRYRDAGNGVPTGLLDITSSLDASAHKKLLESLAEGSRFAASVSLRRQYVVVLAPLRERLVERFDGGLAVSDRAFHLPQWERFQKFHRLSLWREQFALLALDHCRAVEPQLPADLVADAVGAALRDALVARKYGRKEFAPDLLEPFAVIPEIDALIFAPQVAFRDSYYDAVDERTGVRSRFFDFLHERPRGKLLHEKLVDLLGALPATEVARSYLGGSTPWIAVASAAAGRDLSGYVLPWLGPYPRLDYGVASVQATDDAIVVHVSASGPGAADVKEPIVVEVVDAEGKAHRGRTMGPGGVRVEAPSPPKSVQVDPDRRLVELWQSDPGKGSRFNNRIPPRWRFLLNNISGLVGVTGKKIWASVDFSLRRIHDLTHRFDIAVHGYPEKVGGSLGYIHAFGEPITPLYLSQRTGLFATFQRLRNDDGAVSSGQQGTLSAFYRYDTRLSPYWSFEGQGISASASVSAGEGNDGSDHRSVGLGAGVFQILPFAFGHALLLRLRGDLVLGEQPEQDGLRLGDRYRGGRGFEADEARGKTRVIGSAEYRHILQGDARTDLLGLFTWTRLEGALFADAIYLPVDRSGCRQQMFYDVGYGVRVIGDLFGVQPASIAIDLGVPIGRCADQSNTVPITIYLAFVQSFAYF